MKVLKVFIDIKGRNIYREIKMNSPVFALIYIKKIVRKICKAMQRE